MNVITCEAKHIGKLCELTKEFAEETNWPFTYDYEVCSSAFFDYIMRDNSCVMAVEKDGELMAACVLIAAQDFCKETQGFLHKFYVRKKYRKTRCSMLLMKQVCDWFDKSGCVVSFVTSTSGISDEVIETFAKLMEKYNFKKCGPTLARSIYV